MLSTRLDVQVTFCSLSPCLANLECSPRGASSFQEPGRQHDHTLVNWMLVVQSRGMIDIIEIYFKYMGHRAFDGRRSPRSPQVVIVELVPVRFKMWDKCMTS